MTTHRPWFDEDPYITWQAYPDQRSNGPDPCDDNGRLPVCKLLDVLPEDRAFILKAVNNHDELMGLCKDALHFIEHADACSMVMWPGEGKPCDCGVKLFSEKLRTVVYGKTCPRCGGLGAVSPPVRGGVQLDIALTCPDCGGKNARTPS